MIRIKVAIMILDWNKIMDKIYFNWAQSAKFNPYQCDADYYKYRKYVTRIAYMQGVQEYIEKEGYYPIPFSELNTEDKLFEVKMYRRCFECAEVYLKWDEPQLSDLIQLWDKCFPGFITEYAKYCKTEGWSYHE